MAMTMAKRGRSMKMLENIGASLADFWARYRARFAAQLSGATVAATT
jgi:hypothetical protein